jgi:hypothetical protein
MITLRECFSPDLALCKPTRYKNYPANSHIIQAQGTESLDTLSILLLEALSGQAPQHYQDQLREIDHNQDVLYL